MEHLVLEDEVPGDHWHREGDVWVVASRGPVERLELGSFGFRLDVDTLYTGLPLSEPGPTEIAS